MKNKITAFAIATIIAITMSTPIAIVQAQRMSMEQNSSQPEPNFTPVEPPVQPATPTAATPPTVTQPATNGFRSFNLKSLRLTDSKGKEQTSAVFDRKDANGNKISPVVSAILYVTEFLTKVIGSVSLLVLVGAGIFMITNHGEESQVTKGKDMFLYAILGLVFTFSAYFLTTIVQGLFIE
jgi:ABC-type multidrug transport system fused ATPase/permease subunit